MIRNILQKKLKKLFIKPSTSLGSIPSINRNYFISGGGYMAMRPLYHSVPSSIMSMAYSRGWQRWAMTLGGQRTNFWNYWKDYATSSPRKASRHPSWRAHHIGVNHRLLDQTNIPRIYSWLPPFFSPHSRVVLISVNYRVQKLQGSHEPIMFN